MKAERERRRSERGKKRYEQDYSFINEEFFSSWQNRTNNFKSSYDSYTEGGEDAPEMFDGHNLYVDLDVTFEEAM